jgi:PAS domain-containing protein
MMHRRLSPRGMTPAERDVRSRLWHGKERQMTLENPLSGRVERPGHVKFTNGGEPSDTGSQLSNDWFSGDLLETLPAAVYVCDAQGVVVAYNLRASELWGRTPSPGDTDEKYCGSHKLFRPDGMVLPHHETPMEAVLRTGTPARDMEVVIERPDSSRITVLVNIAPLFGEDGKLIRRGQLLPGSFRL